jgi:hypothetical protein
MDTLIIPRFREEMFSDGIRLGVRGMGTLAREVTPQVRRLTWEVAILILAFTGLTIGHPGNQSQARVAKN